MVKKLRIALCYSGQIRGVQKCLYHNNKFFSEVCEKNPFEIDTFCHFWDVNNVYPYHLSTDIKKTLQLLTVDNHSDIEEAIEILKPKQIKINRYTDLISDFYKNVLSRPLHFHLKELYDTILNSRIDNNYTDLVNFRKLHNIINEYVIQNAQFYGFQESVMLAKEYSSTNTDLNNNYDVIIRCRYDGMYTLTSVDAMIYAINASIQNQSIMVNSLRSYEYNNGIRDTEYHNNTNNRNMYNISPNSSGIDDTTFVGTATKMYYYAENISKNVSNHYAWFDKEKIMRYSPEYMWFCESIRKNLLVETIDAATTAYILIRSLEQLSEFERYNDQQEYLNNCNPNKEKKKPNLTSM